MKLTYNILLSFVQVLCAAALVAMGFARMLAWTCRFWLNDLIYLFFALLVLVGHRQLLRWGRKKEWTVPAVLKGLAAVDYILYSAQLALVGAWLVWEFASPLYGQTMEKPLLQLAALLPVAAVDIIAMLLRQRSNPS